MHLCSLTIARVGLPPEYYAQSLILAVPRRCLSGRRRLDLVQHLSEQKLDHAISETKKAVEARLVRRLCFVKILYAGIVWKKQPAGSVSHRSARTKTYPDSIFTYTYQLAVSS